MISKEILKQLYNDYIGWFVLALVLFPLGLLLDTKLMECIAKIRRSNK